MQICPLGSVLEGLSCDPVGTIAAIPGYLPLDLEVGSPNSVNLATSRMPWHSLWCANNPPEAPMAQNERKIPLKVSLQR